MQGRRIPTPPNEWTESECPVQSGDFWKDKNGDWHGVTPNDLWVWLKNHHVEEHEDGTITVVAGPLGSNSILAGNGSGNKSWHGYIEKGIWKEC